MKFYKNKKFYIITFVTLFIIILLFFSGILIRTALVNRPEVISCGRNETNSYILDNRTIGRFQRSLNFQTISLQNPNEFRDLINFIEKSFPAIHSSNLVARSLLQNFSLLYEIKGRDSSLKPYLLIGHLDVVPVKASEWNYDPFASEIHEGYIYGRGSLDAKYIVMGILEALERILQANVTIDRGFYLVFGHDEESMGLTGARTIADMLKNQSVEFEFALDEGTFVMPDLIPGLNDDVTPAFVSITEKGYLTVNISVTSDPGHSSMPPYEAAPVILATALSKLKGDSQPNVFGSGPEVNMFVELAPYANFLHKMIFSNLWLFSGLLGKMLAKKPRSSALTRSTTAVTIISAGIKENVIPSVASALVNLRVHPADTNAKVLQRLKDIIDDERLKVTSVRSVEPPFVSSTADSSYGFQIIKRAIGQTYPKTIVIPAVLIASTDSKWFQPITKDIYRFSPATVLAKDLTGIHGNNERISLDSYQNAIRFYSNLITEANNRNLDC